MASPFDALGSQRIFEAVPDALIIVDTKGRLAAVNPSAYTLLGVIENAPLGMPLGHLLAAPTHGVPDAGITAFLTASAPDGWAKTGTLVARRGDGSDLLLEARSSPLDDQWTLVSLRALPETAPLEEALKENERRLRTLIDATPDLIYFKDGAGRWMVANPAALRLFELVDVAYQGKSDQEIAELAQPCYRDALNYCSVTDEGTWAEGAATRAIERVPTADGGVCYADVIKVPLYEEDGRRKGLVILGRDITELKRAEEARQHSEERLALAVRGANLGLWNLDLASGQLELNEGSASLFGYAADQVPRTLDERLNLIHPDDRQALRDNLELHIAGQSAEFRSEHRLRTREGEWRWILETGQVVERDAEGRPRRVAGVCMDIDARKRSEQALRTQRAEMERLMHERVASLTAAAIAHELNQPLNAVAAYSEAALRLLELGNPKPEKLTHALQQALQQTRRAGQAMRDLLALLHHGEPLTETLCLNTLVRETLVVLQDDGVISPMETRVRLDTNLAPVAVNRLHVDKVLQNLLINAIEAMRTAGASSMQLSVATSSRDGMALVTVQDGGPGIPPEDLASIFEPFFTTKSHGVGMGLAVSRALIRAHGGELWVESDLGNGAAFHFTLPFAA